MNKYSYINNKKKDSPTKVEPPPTKVEPPITLAST